MLQRQEEVELPPGATDAERAAARAEAAAGVEHAANELGGHWAEAYQELHPDWQPPPTGIEMSNQRAAELTAATEQIARLTASISVLRAHITRLEAGITAVHDELSDAINVTNAAINDPARDSGARRGLEPHNGRHQRLDTSPAADRAAAGAATHDTATATPLHRPGQPPRRVSVADSAYCSRFAVI